MTGEQRKRIAEAFKIIERYRRALIERMASDIIEHREDFENPFLGSAESVVDKYNHLLSCLYAISAELSGYLPRQPGRRPPNQE